MWKRKEQPMKDEEERGGVLSVGFVKEKREHRENIKKDNTTGKRGIGKSAERGGTCSSSKKIKKERRRRRKRIRAKHKRDWKSPSQRSARKGRQKEIRRCRKFNVR